MCYSSKFRYLAPYQLNRNNYDMSHNIYDHYHHTNITEHDLLTAHLKSSLVPHDVYLETLNVDDIKQMEFQDQLVRKINEESSTIPSVLSGKREESFELPSYDQTNQSYQYNGNKNYQENEKEYLPTEKLLNLDESKELLPLPVTMSNNSNRSISANDKSKRQKVVIGCLVLVFLVLINTVIASSGCMNRMMSRNDEPTIEWNMNQNE
ncbi:hypothetical protein WICPIJ_009284 [Wickerhamomyces pijperi]|uniref:Uncharacterized protein n=1 Tax=Wickerhamomyces pijperi TaxID=599730 RepID=A0A9P8PQN8_WICPI|nr:hypothetical protein WICPIJ_009284 [Wickerhamomyces pijperi]